MMQRLEESKNMATKESMLFVDNNILFDGISRLDSEIVLETESEIKESFIGMVDNLKLPVGGKQP